MSKTIAIINNEFTSKIEGSRYLLAQMVERWKNGGFEISVSAGCKFIPADLAILHVDTTVVGDEYMELASRYPVVLNGKVRDILKSSVSQYLLAKDDTYEGPVIVKTNANYGGFNEFVIAAESGKATWYDPDTERPWRKREVMDSMNYPVFSSISDVPPGVWKNDRLVVEKFLPERLENGDYRCRSYFFFGRQEFATWISSPRPVFKTPMATGTGVIREIPQSLRDIRKRSGFDFGKFDYTEVNGEVFVYDMNKTPAFGTVMQSLFSTGELDTFASAIHDFL